MRSALDTLLFDEMSFDKMSSSGLEPQSTSIFENFILKNFEILRLRLCGSLKKTLNTDPAYNENHLKEFIVGKFSKWFTDQKKLNFR